MLRKCLQEPLVMTGKYLQSGMSKRLGLKDTKGNIIIDFSNNNLHLMGYSIACHELLSYDNLIKHLYYIQAQPEAIPYRTSYYTKRWGFCLSYNQFLSLNPQRTI